MKEILFWKIAWRNLLRHRKRNGVTGAAIALGFAAVLLLGGYMLRMEDYLSTQAIYLDHAGLVSIYRLGGLDRALVDPEKANLTESDQNEIFSAIQSLPEKPEFIGKYLKGQGVISNGCQSYPFLATGIEPQIEAKIRNHPQVLKDVPELVRLKKGKGFWEDGVEQDSLMITGALAHLLKKPLVRGEVSENLSALNQLITDCQGKSVSDLISSHSGLQLIGNTFDHRFAGADARISGHFTTGLLLSEDSAILFPLDLARRFYETQSVTWIAAFFPKNISAAKMTRELKEIFSRSKAPFEVYPYYDERVSPFYVGAMSFVNVMTLFFVFLVCGVVALSVINALQLSFFERKSEIGTLRAIGFRPQVVSGLILREVVLLSFFSCVIGGVGAGIAASIVNQMNIRFDIVGSAEKLQFMLKPGILFSFLMGGLFILCCFLAGGWICMGWSKHKIVTLLEMK